MKIYLINNKTNEIVNEYTNVISWGCDFVEYMNGNCRAKIYCGEDEYFTDKEVQDVN